MTPAFNLNAIAQASAVQILYCLVEGTLIAVFTAGALGLSRRQNSVTRFAVWFSALMAIATLPFLTGSLWSHVGSTPQDAVTRSVITLPGSWAVYLFGAWAAIAGWHFVGIGRGLWHLHVLRKSCVVVDPAILDVRLQQTMARNQSPRRIVLCTSAIAHVPTALGLVKPAIVIPKWVMQELSSDELNQILLHELAHLRRWDDWTNLAQKIVKALFFFHPAVWWIEQRVSLEREMACDEAVLEETASPRAYAECLAHLAERTLIQRSIALAQAALGKIHQTSLRVAQILDTNRPSGTTRSWKPAVSLVAVFAVACVLGLTRAPRLIVFSDSVGSQVAEYQAAGNQVVANEAADSSVDVVRGMTPPIVNASAKMQPHHRSFSGSSFSGSSFSRPARVKAEGAPPMASKLALRGCAEKSVAQDTLDDSILQAAAVEDSASAPSMFHLTNSSAPPLVFTETLFVVIDGRARFYGQPAFQIQLWRVLVLHPVVDPNSNRIPPKQT